jgi:aryl-alcohol dehydrogenase-like predicted oxidoreductase
MRLFVFWSLNSSVTLIIFTVNHPQASHMPPRVPLLFGTATFGTVEHPIVRTHTLPDALAILDAFFRHGHRQLDTAGYYGHGTTEKMLSQLNTEGSTIDTKYACLTINHF